MKTLTWNGYNSSFLTGKTIFGHTCNTFNDSLIVAGGFFWTESAPLDPDMATWTLSLPAVWAFDFKKKQFNGLTFQVS